LKGGGREDDKAKERRWEGKKRREGREGTKGILYTLLAALVSAAAFRSI
jgi:hypothetical protein